LLSEYVSYHHEDRTHWGLGQDRLNGRTALEELREGHVDSVISAARSYGEQGAS